MYQLTVTAYEGIEESHVTVTLRDVDEHGGTKRLMGTRAMIRASEHHDRVDPAVAWVDQVWLYVAQQLRVWSKERSVDGGGRG